MQCNGVAWVSVTVDAVHLFAVPEYGVTANAEIVLEVPTRTVWPSVIEFGRIIVPVASVPASSNTTDVVVLGI